MRTARISIVNSRKAVEIDDNERILEKAEDSIRIIGRDRPDLIVLSEHFATTPQQDTPEAVLKVAQSVPGPQTERLASLAKKYESYIAFGMLRREDEEAYNSLILIDRKGRPVWIYDKVFPTIGELKQKRIRPGGDPKAFDCDFGRIGAAICFDINFLELADFYQRAGVELILFSSAFPGGRLLDMWAVRFGFNIAASTRYEFNRIIDLTGNTLNQTSDINPQVTAAVNLNRRMVHMDFNLDKIESMIQHYPGDVLIEDLRPEATCVITSIKAGLEVEELLREFEIEKLPDYFDRSRKIRLKHTDQAAIE